MSDTEQLVLFTVLSDAHDNGDPYASAVSERLAQWLDQMNLNLVGIDEEGNPIKHAPTACTAEQQLRAARFLEFDLRDSIVIAKNNQTKSSTETKTARIERLTGELDALMSVLPERLPDAELERILTDITMAVFVERPHESAAKLTGVALNRLRTDHFGKYDGRKARDVVKHLVDSLVGS